MNSFNGSIDGNLLKKGTLVPRMIYWDHWSQIPPVLFGISDQLMMDTFTFLVTMTASKVLDLYHDPSVPCLIEDYENLTKIDLMEGEFLMESESLDQYEEYLRLCSFNQEKAYEEENELWDEHYGDLLDKEA